MAATYVKRYAQQALLNISTEDDDDAASLNGSNKTEKSAAAVKYVHPSPSTAMFTRHHHRASQPIAPPKRTFRPYGPSR
jgi:ERF superfamily